MGWMPISAVILLFSLLVQGAPDPTAADLVRRLEERPRTSIADFIASLPESWRSRWFPMPTSGSTQQGLRFLLSSPNAGVTVAFNLDPARSGFGAVEIRELDPVRNRHVFHEIVFEGDYGRITEKFARYDAAPRFRNGYSVHNDILQQPLHGSSGSCSNCHSASGPRFDLRDVNGRLERGFRNPGSSAALVALLRDRTDPRLRSLVVNERLQALLRAGNAAAIEAHWKEEAAKLFRDLTEHKIRTLVPALERLLEDEPEAALGMLGAIDRCDMAAFFTRPQWERRIRHFSTDTDTTEGYLNEEHQAMGRLTWSVPPAVAAAIGIIKGKVERERRNELSASAVRNTDESADVETLARMEFYWNPVVATAKRRTARLKPGERERALLDRNLLVALWPMNAHHNGHWYSETYPLYLRAMRKMLIRFVERKFTLPDKAQVCETLARRHREEYERRDGAEARKKDHDE